MAQCPWKLIELKVREKERTRARTKAVEAMEQNGLVSCMDVDVAVDAQTKAKERAKAKASRRARKEATVGPKARRAQVVERWLMDSAQTVTSMATGAEIARIW